MRNRLYANVIRIEIVIHTSIFPPKDSIHAVHAVLMQGPCGRYMQSAKSFEVGGSQRLYDARAFAEPGSEDSVGILEHAVFQTDDNELRALEPSLDQTPYILRVREVQSGVNLIQDVHRCRFELE